MNKDDDDNMKCESTKLIRIVDCRGGGQHRATMAQVRKSMPRVATRVRFKHFQWILRKRCSQEDI